ncbi:hypothetical protein JH146_0080 [Methanocaldococcus bathoardescens]|uniref:ATP-grasp domain-containing protein n=1 Tax=Methanocaldococcus bathoardescens TaxID=1301915 RepID=A0A076L9P4_9EURY|nr:ATP-grasp domain-containing protein [Methanocaldococcus bathoardescens]AIJ04931.1 hypothetical protein JH146_0080 [Methanocaldococcus bathoardescens]
MKRKSFRVLITGVGSTTAISVIKGLRMQNEYDVFIVGVDINDKDNIAGSKFCDKFFKIPPAIEEKKYINTLVEIITSESIDLLIPIIDIELEIISQNINILNKYTNVLISPYETIIICNDKYETYKFFSRIGVPTPKTLLLNTINDFDFDQIIQDLYSAGIDFPIIVKPRKGVSSRNVYEIYNKDELCLLRRVNEPIIQEKVEGQEYTIDVFSDGKKVVSVVPRKRIEVRSGISYKGQTVKDPELIDYAKKIVEELKIIGPANIQCFKNEDDVKFIEINPRFSGSLPLTIAAGVNTPLFALKMIAGENLKTVKNFKIVRMCRYWSEVFYYEN